MNFGQALHCILVLLCVISSFVSVSNLLYANSNLCFPIFVRFPMPLLRRGRLLQVGGLFPLFVQCLLTAIHSKCYHSQEIVKRGSNHSHLVLIYTSVSAWVVCDGRQHPLSSDPQIEYTMHPKVFDLEFEDM